MLFLCQKTHREKTKRTGKMSASPRYRMKIHRVVESEDSLDLIISFSGMLV